MAKKKPIISPETPPVPARSPAPPATLRPCRKCGAKVAAVGEPTQQPYDGSIILRQRVRCTASACGQFGIDRTVTLAPSAG